MNEIKIRKKGHHAFYPADVGMLILLRRLVYPWFSNLGKGLLQPLDGTMLEISERQEQQKHPPGQVRPHFEKEGQKPYFELRTSSYSNTKSKVGGD